MRPLLLSLLAVAACAKAPSVDEAQVHDYLDKHPALRADIVAKASARPEHVGAIHRGDAALTIVGDTLEVGAEAPDVMLVEMVDGNKRSPMQLASLRGKVVVLSVVPSIDTRVCEAQTHAISNAIPQLPPDTVVMTVSRDLPFAQTRFAEEAMTQTRMGSDYHGGAFGQAFGLEVKETGLLARSAWVIDRAGKIAYRDLVDDQGDQPDYDALFAAVTRIAAE